MAGQAVTVTLRPESDGDADAIADITRRAFDEVPHSDGSEPDIIDRLRRAEALTLSLVAVEGDDILGHVAISPVDWEGGTGWFGLGPVSVDPARQSTGIGSALIRHALDQLEAKGAAGCVVLGDPAYYTRFGFVADPHWTYPGPPPEYFMARPFRPSGGTGIVRYHPAFG